MKRSRLNNPMSLIVLGYKKTPVGSKISVIGWLKGNLNMTHMGNFYFREGKRNPMTMLPTTQHFFQDIVKSWYKQANSPAQMD